MLEQAGGARGLAEAAAFSPALLGILLPPGPPGLGGSLNRVQLSRATLVCIQVAHSSSGLFFNLGDPDDRAVGAGDLHLLADLLVHCTEEFVPDSPVALSQGSFVVGQLQICFISV